jgi:signal transduction histidine kinase/ActR/RegA family two-component response regulator
LTRKDQSPLPVRIEAERVEGVDAMTLIVEDLTERERHRAMQERARRNDHFLAVLAHELRNPLGSIRNAAAILARSTLGQRDRAALGVIERQSETLVRLVDDLLDVHRLNEGKMVLHRTAVDVRGAIDDAVSAVGQNLTTKAQLIDVRLADEPLYIDGDPVRIAQVLTNLLLNASKFTGKGGRIAIAAERSTSDGVAAVRISVTDNGIGLAPDQLERIFEPYVQASAEASTFPEGLGLGLSVARRLIDLHGGTIHARSDGPGRGSTFVVELPLCDPPSQLSTSTTGQQREERAARILIADDDRDSASTLCSLLELSGHETYATHDGESAIALADKVQPDVVILDIQMPKVDGYAAARALRDRPWAARLLLYALTGWGEPTDPERMRGARFDRYFVKPVSLDRLTSELARDLLQRRPPQEVKPSELDAEDA